MAKKSKENGDKGERIALSWMRNHGYWAHLIKRNNQGSQPFDLIAVRKVDDEYSVIMADIKYVESGGLFPFSDIQPNQVESMHYASKFAGIDSVGFIVIFGEFGDEIRFYSYFDFLKDEGGGKKSKPRAMMGTLGIFL